MDEPFPSPPSAPRRWRRPAAIVLGISIALSAAMAWPVLIRPTERIFGTELVGRAHDPFTVMQQFAGAPVGAPFLQPATDWTGRALATIVPPVAAFNALVLLSFPLSALGAFLFAYELTGSALAAMAAGLAFAFSPVRLAHAAYHVHIAQTQWLPLYLLALWRMVHRASLTRAACVVAAGIVAASSSDYAAMMLATLTPPAAILFWLAPSRRHEAPTMRDLAWTAGLLLGAGAAALLVISRAFPIVFAHPDLFSVAQGDVFRHSARWWSYLVPPADHPLLGRWAADLWARDGGGPGFVEQQNYLGYGLLLLAGIPLVVRSRRDSEPGRACAPHLAVLLGIGAWCSLAPSVHVLGLTIAGPSALIYAVLPMFRAFARFAIVVQLLTAVLAGIGLATLWNSRRGPLRGAAVLAVVVLMGEYSPLQARWRDVLPTTAHRWLSAHGGHQAVFDCTEPSPGEQATSWLAGYPVGRLDAMIQDCGEPDLAPKLKALGYAYLVVRRDRPEARWLRAHGGPHVDMRYDGPDAAAFAIDATATPVFAAEPSGFYPREYSSERTWRWMKDRAALAIVNLDAQPHATHITLELAAFGHPRHVTVSMDGTEVGQFVVQPAPGPFALDSVVLVPGRHTLTIQSAEPPLVPAQLDGGTDPRPIALALGGWTP